MASDPLLRYLERPGRRRLARVVAEHHRHVWSLALRVTGNEDDAYDIAQDVFLGLFLDPPAPQDVLSPRGYLSWRVVARASRLRRAVERRERREEEHGRRVARDVSAPDDVAAVRESLARLADEDRMVLELRYLAEMSTAEISRALGISDRAVRLRLEKARDRLRAGLSASFPGVFVAGALELAEAAPPAGVLARLLRVVEISDALAPVSGTALAAASAAPSTSTATFAKLGGAVLSTKKVLASGLAAAIFLVGASFWFTADWSARRSGAPDADTGSAVSAPGGEEAALAGARSTAAETATSEVAQVDAVVPDVDPSIHGRIRTRSGDPVAGAEIWALDDEAWRRVARERGVDGLSYGVDSDEALAALRASFAPLLAEAVSTASDSAGSYELRDLAPRTFRLVVLAAGFVPHNDTLVDVAATPAERDVELLPGATISGTVVDESGDPVRGAEIIAQPSSRRFVGEEELVAQALLRWEKGLFVLEGRPRRTDADGSFEVPYVESLRYDVVARESDRLPASARDVPAGARDVVLVLRAGCRIAGRVLREDRSPLAGAVIEAISARPREVHRHFDGRVDAERLARVTRCETVSAADGAFVVAGLEPGHWDLRVTSQGHAPLARELVLESDATELGDVVLAEAREISGIVRAAGGRPVSGAVVRGARPLRQIRPANRITRDLPEAFVETSSARDGSFTLAGLPLEPLDILVEHPSHALAVVHAVEPGATGVVVELVDGARVEGRVVEDASGAAVAEARVISGYGLALETRTDAEGRFELRGLSFEDTFRGRTALRVLHEDFDEERVEFPLRSHDARSEVTVRLRRDARVEGRVVDPAGAGVRGALVEFVVRGLPMEAAGYNPARGMYTDSDADGRFSMPAPVGLERMIGDIRLSLEARLSGFAGARHDFAQLPSTGTPWPEVTLVLEPGALLDGIVRDTSGQGIAGARVEALPAGSDAIAPAEGGDRRPGAFTDSGGRFVLGDLAPGALTQVRVAASGFAPARLEVVAGAAPLDVVLTPGLALEGRVVDQNGAPLGDAEIEALPGEIVGRLDDARSAFARRMFLRLGAGRYRGQSGEDGRFVIADLPDEELVLVAHAPGYEARATPPVRPGERVADIELQRFSAVTGRVLVDGTRAPVRSFTLDVVNTETRAREQERTRMQDSRLGSEGALTFHDPYGRFFYDGLRPGSYELRVSSDEQVHAVQEVELLPGEEREIEVLLAPGGTLELEVRFAESETPVEGAIVHARRSGSLDYWPRDEVYTGADGRATVRGLESGEYRVAASHPFALRDHDHGRTVTVEVSEGETVTALVHLRPAGRLEGVLTGLATRRHGNVRTTHSIEWQRAGESDAQKEAPAWSRTISVQGDGTFAEDSLEPGAYRLSLISRDIEDGDHIALGPSSGLSTAREVGPERRHELGEVTIEAGETTRFERRIPSAATGE